MEEEEPGPVRAETEEASGVIIEEVEEEHETPAGMNILDFGQLAEKQKQTFKEYLLDEQYQALLDGVFAYDVLHDILTEDIRSVIVKQEMSGMILDFFRPQVLWHEEKDQGARDDTRMALILPRLRAWVAARLEYVSDYHMTAFVLGLHKYVAEVEDVYGEGDMEDVMWSDYVSEYAEDLIDLNLATQQVAIIQVCNRLFREKGDQMAEDTSDEEYRKHAFDFVPKSVFDYAIMEKQLALEEETIDSLHFSVDVILDIQQELLRTLKQVFLATNMHKLFMHVKRWVGVTPSSAPPPTVSDNPMMRWYFGGDPDPRMPGLLEGFERIDLEHAGESEALLAPADVAHAGEPEAPLPPEDVAHADAPESMALAHATFIPTAKKMEKDYADVARIKRLTTVITAVVSHLIAGVGGGISARLRNKEKLPTDMIKNLSDMDWKREENKRFLRVADEANQDPKLAIDAETVHYIIVRHEEGGKPSITGAAQNYETDTAMREVQERVIESFDRDMTSEPSYMALQGEPGLTEAFMETLVVPVRSVVTKGPSQKASIIVFSERTVKAVQDVAQTNFAGKTKELYIYLAGMVRYNRKLGDEKAVMDPLVKAVEAAFSTENPLHEFSLKFAFKRNWFSEWTNPNVIPTHAMQWGPTRKMLLQIGTLWARSPDVFSFDFLWTGLRYMSIGTILGNLIVDYLNEVPYFYIVPAAIAVTAIMGKHWAKWMLSEKNRSEKYIQQLEKKYAKKAGRKVTAQLFNIGAQIMLTNLAASYMIESYRNPVSSYGPSIVRGYVYLVVILDFVNLTTFAKTSDLAKEIKNSNIGVITKMLWGVVKYILPAVFTTYTSVASLAWLGGYINSDAIMAPFNTFRGKVPESGAEGMLRAASFGSAAKDIPEWFIPILGGAQFSLAALSLSYPEMANWLRYTGYGAIMLPPFCGRLLDQLTGTPRGVESTLGLIAGGNLAEAIPFFGHLWVQTPIIPREIKPCKGIEPHLQEGPGPLAKLKHELCTNPTFNNLLQAVLVVISFIGMLDLMREKISYKLRL